MPDSNLKNELLDCIKNTNDEELLSLMKEDFVFYGKVKDAGIADNLNEKQILELRALSEEDEMKDTMTLDEFKQATQQWRTK